MANAVDRAAQRDVPASRQATAEQIMTRRVYWVRPEVALSCAAEIMRDHDLSGLPVVDASGQLIGMLSRADLARGHSGEGSASTVVRRLPSGVHEVRATTVGDVMTKGAVRVAPSCSLAQIAQLLSSTGLHRLAVVDAAGHLVGVVSRTDIVRWVAGLA